MLASKILPNSNTSQQLRTGRLPVASPPPTAEEIDLLQCHIALQRFGEAVELAARDLFPNNPKSRYKNVHVLLLSWEDEDPQLPVSLEISKLFDVFVNIYHFQTEIWHIPNQNSHNKVSKKILEFVGDDSKDDLKIVYYAGHGRLTKNRLLSWTSWRSDQGPKCPVVAWSGIQNVLEQSQSDVLILLDCCASGTVNTDNGEGVTEIISACSFNSIANGVGEYSFTRELTIELETLSATPFFTTEQLYNNIYRRIQARMPENGRERHPAPIRLVLTNETPRPRSLQLSKMANSQEKSNLKIMHDAATGRGLHTFREKQSVHQSTQAKQFLMPTSGSKNVPDLSKILNSVTIRSTSFSTKVSRLSLNFRLNENLRVCDLSTDSFKEWLRNIPAAAEELKVEAGLENSSVTQKHAQTGFYGYLFEKNRKPTRMLVKLLEGIGNYIIDHIGNLADKSLSPPKLARFYQSVGGNYDSIFVDVPHSSISWIWSSIGCRHSLLPSKDSWAAPSIPALTKSGFVRWESIEILLDPGEHVLFIQNALRRFPIKDPDTNKLFPKDLPEDVFPLQPDPEILKWHTACARRLRRQGDSQLTQQPPVPWPEQRKPNFKRNEIKSKGSLNHPLDQHPRSQLKPSTPSRNLRREHNAHSERTSSFDHQEPFREYLLKTPESCHSGAGTLRSYLRVMLSEDSPLTQALQDSVPPVTQLPERSLKQTIGDNPRIESMPHEEKEFFVGKEPRQEYGFHDFGFLGGGIEF